MPPIKSDQESTGGGERHNTRRSNPKVDSKPTSQLAADPNSNDPTGQHRIKSTLSLSIATLGTQGGWPERSEPRSGAFDGPGAQATRPPTASRATARTVASSKSNVDLGDGC